MGATVTTSRRVAAFRSLVGKNIYLLFESTYEKNCYPHTPHWNCVAIGELRDVMDRIFAFASECEGGMLQNPSGRITAEGYIQTWLKELEAPIEFRDRALNLRFKPGTFVPLPEDGAIRKFVSKELAALGRTDILTPLLNGEAVTISLVNDIDVIIALYGTRGKMSPWRIIDSGRGPEGERNASLGYAPKPARKFTVELPSALRFNEREGVLLPKGSGWRYAGWAYSVVQRFIRNLWEAELREPKSYAKRIKAYREAVHQAPIVPLDKLKVVVDATVPLTKDWHLRKVAEFPKRFAVTTTATGFEAQPDENNLYEAQNLPDECMHWEVEAEWAAANIPAVMQSGAEPTKTAVVNDPMPLFA